MTMSNVTARLVVVVVAGRVVVAVVAFLVVVVDFSVVVFEASVDVVLDGLLVVVVVAPGVVLLRKAVKPFCALAAVGESLQVQPTVGNPHPCLVHLKLHGC